MKKILSLLGLLLLCGIFCACSSSDDEETEKKLGYYVSNGKVYLAIPSIEKTLYIKVYRKDLDGNINNVGQIKPATWNTLMSYTFADELTANKKYKYMAVYYLLNGYDITDWTDEITVYGSSFANEPVPVIQDGVYFEYDSKTLRMQLKNGNICFPDKDKNDAEDISRGDSDPEPEDDSLFKDFTLTLCFASGDDTTVIKLNDEHKVYEQDEFLSMDSVLPNGYIGRQLSQIGLMYQRIETYPPDSKDFILYKTVHWSLPAKIKISENGKILDPLVVSKHSSEESQFDYDKPIKYSE